MSSNYFGSSPQNQAADKYLERLVEELDVPPSRYESAERSYLSVGDWLDRDDSSLKKYAPKVYVQGSFRLGTAIRPVNEEEDYDIDLVCELERLSKTGVSQAYLKEMLLVELAAYAKSHGMSVPHEGRRCWTLNYADGAQFHLDALPAVSDGVERVAGLKSRALSHAWAATAIAITDNESPGYQQRLSSWPHSNPKGYNLWFQSRMQVAFDARRAAMALAVKASIEDIPEYRVKTPLQAVIQILKRHRDITFADRPEDKPISIIITTLAAKSYANEPSVSAALKAVLAGMDSHIETRAGVKWVANPTDPEENFADRWQKYPQRHAVFQEWLATARSHFEALFGEQNRERLVEHATKWAGMAPARRAAAGMLAQRAPSMASIFRNATYALGASHRKPVPWPTVKLGQVAIEQAIVSRAGFRPQTFQSNSPPLPKGASLRFVATTNVPGPYQVFWQVVNTGDEAVTANCLRGGFDTGLVERGTVVRTEGTAYKGTHTIECFIVKDAYLVARSGVFVVNID